MSEQGVAFLTAALDPMHDKPIKHLDGIPDLEAGRSVVRCVKTSTTLKTPFGATENWNAHIVGWPFLTKLTGSLWSRQGNLFSYSSNNPTNSYGGTTAHASRTDTFNWLGILNTDAPTPIGSVELPDIYHKGMGRLIGYGIEVVNTTAELEKQGLVTVYEVNNSQIESSAIMLRESGRATGVCTGVRIRPPASSLADATNMPGALQWEAKDGAYMVNTFNANETAARTPQYNMVWFSSDDAVPGFKEPPNFATVWSNEMLQQDVNFFPSCPIKIEDVNTKCMIFSGLSPQTTLTLRTNWYYESFPSFDEKPILVLATESPLYDPIAMKIYKEMISELPVGVKATMNPDGEWFWNVVKDISEILPGIASAIFPELAPVLLPLGELGTRTAKQHLKHKNTNGTKKTKHPQQQVERITHAKAKPLRKQKHHILSDTVPARGRQRR